jgi:hypothetical protein
MILQVYKVSIWKQGVRIALAECKIFTEDISEVFKLLPEIEFGLPEEKYTYTVNYIERPDIDQVHDMEIRYINKAKSDEL